MVREGNGVHRPDVVAESLQHRHGGAVSHAPVDDARLDREDVHGGRAAAAPVSSRAPGRRRGGAAPVEEPPEVVHEEGGHLLVAGGVEPAEVRQYGDARRGPERMIVGQGLDPEDVQDRARDRVALDRVDQIQVDDQLAARS